jgi:hypothetical protein
MSCPESPKGAIGGGAWSGGGGGPMKGKDWDEVGMYSE